MGEVSPGVRGTRNDEKGARDMTAGAAHGRVPDERAITQLDHLERHRRRLAFDVHDGVAQTLCAALLQVETLDESVGTERVHLEVATLRSLLEHALDEVRDLVAELRPPSIDAASLEEKLRGYVVDFEARTGLRVDFRVDLNGEQLSPSAQIAVFRIVQECLTNIRKHARVPEARVDVWVDSDVIRCRVVDRGVGFDPDAVWTGGRDVGHGLRGIRERAALLNGRVEIDSAPGVGTTITMGIPIWR